MSMPMNRPIIHKPRDWPLLFDKHTQNEGDSAANEHPAPAGKAHGDGRNGPQNTDHHKITAIRKVKTQGASHRRRQEVKSHHRCQNAHETVAGKAHSMLGCHKDCKASKGPYEDQEQPKKSTEIRVAVTS